jgi:hypothetical protein
MWRQIGGPAAFPQEMSPWLLHVDNDNNNNNKKKKNVESVFRLVNTKKDSETSIFCVIQKQFKHF